LRHDSPVAASATKLFVEFAWYPSPSTQESRIQPFALLIQPPDSTKETPSFDAETNVHERTLSLTPALAGRLKPDPEISARLE